MAANGVDIKLGVSGVSQFKQNMNQAKQAVKTLDAQLTLTEKQFKSTGDAEGYMTEKSELLKAKLEQQKQVLANAEKALEDMKDRGIDKASKAYQDMYRQMLAAKGALIDTQTQMDNMTESTDEAASGVSEMNSQLSEIGKGISWQNVTDGLSSITSGMEAVITKAYKVGQAIVQATLGAGAWADELDETATKYEITPEQLYRMRQVADFIDTDVDTIISAQDKLAKNNSQKGESYMGALAFLNIDPTGKSNTDLFWEAGEAIANLGENADKTYYATQIFGKSWRELLPLFTAGREGYNAAYENTSWIGDENFESLTKLDDASQSLNHEWETLQNTFMGTLSGPLKEVLEILTGVLQEFNKYLQSDEGKQKMKELGETLTGWVKDLETIDPGALIDSIRGGLEWIVNNAEGIKNAIIGFGVALAGLKLAEVASNVFRIISGVKGLTGGSAGSGAAGAEGSGAAASGGGATSGIMPWLSDIASKVAAFITSQGELPGVAGDMFLNQTNAGRALRDGTDVLEGVKADFEEKVKEVQHNAETFSQDWEDNVLMQLGKNNILFWNDQLKAWQLMDANNTGDHGGYVAPETPKSEPTSNWEFGDDWSIEEQLAWVNAQTAADKMAAAAEDLSGDSDANRQSSSDMSSAAGTLKGMPGQVEEAIIRGMSGIKIYIDGQQAGSVLTPYLNSGLAGVLATFTK